MYKVAQFSIFYPASFSTFLCDILALETLILTLMPKASGFAIFVRAEEFWKNYFNDLCSFYLGVPAVESELIGAPRNM
jgi:hypothetical protein